MNVITLVSGLDVYVKLAINLMFSLKRNKHNNTIINMYIVLIDDNNRQDQIKKMIDKQQLSSFDFVIKYVDMLPEYKMYVKDATTIFPLHKACLIKPFFNIKFNTIDKFIFMDADTEVRRAGIEDFYNQDFNNFLFYGDCCINYNQPYFLKLIGFTHIPADKTYINGGLYMSKPKHLSKSCADALVAMMNEIVNFNTIPMSFKPKLSEQDMFNKYLMKEDIVRIPYDPINLCKTMDLNKDDSYNNVLIAHYNGNKMTSYYDNLLKDIIL